MATAEKTTVIAEKLVKVEEEAFTLTLSKDEAETLRIIFNVIGGSPVSSRRKHTDAMDRALYESNVARLIVDEIDGASRRGVIYFKDDPSMMPAAEEPLKVGDRVKMIGKSIVGSDVSGRIGALTEIDPDDTRWPYRVETNDRGYWVESVERIEG